MQLELIDSNITESKGKTGLSSYMETYGRVSPFQKMEQCRVQ